MLLLKMEFTPLVNQLFYAFKQSFQTKIEDY